MNCPKCGSKSVHIEGKYAKWACESYTFGEGFYQDNACLASQRDQLLVKVNRMEKIGDEMADWSRNPRNLGRCEFTAEQWDQAKGIQ